MNLAKRIERARRIGRMRNNFLPIPDAPNYEINSQLICRNRRTKEILGINIDYKKFQYYSLRTHWRKGTVKRSPETFRAQAEAATKNGKFEPIGSLNGQYEIDEKGTIRNAVTKRIIKTTRNGKIVNLRCNGVYASRAVADLLWEAHGIIVERRYRPQPCFIENAHGKIFFPYLRACARYLAPKIFYAVSTIAHWLGDRREQIGEWKISYPPREVHAVKWDGRLLTKIAKQQARLYKELGLTATLEELLS